jgi:hypothetical protein
VARLPQSPPFSQHCRVVKRQTISNISGIKAIVSNTGVLSGIALATDPPVRVQVTVDLWKVTTDGSVIDGKDIINKMVDIAASYVTS